LFRTIELMRRVAIEVSHQLGYTYPDDLEHRVRSYLQKVKERSKRLRTHPLP